MKLVPQSAPYIRKKVSVSRMMLDVIIALLPISLFAMIYYKWDSIYVFIISILTMLFFELLINMFIKWPKGMKFKELFSKDGFNKIKEGYTINNILAPLISSMIFALIMPAGSRPFIVFVGAAFGIIIGKMVFGGLGSNIFNPAAVGRVFTMICFGSDIGKANVECINAGATPLGTANGVVMDTQAFKLIDLFTGNDIGGTMGEGCKILIILGGLYLFARRSADIRSTLSYLLSFMLVMFVASVSYLKVDSDFNVFKNWLYQILAGGVIFAAVFMITDPVTSPTSKFGRVLFGCTAGMITALIRVVGSYPEGAAFSILIVNMLAPTIDHFMRGKPNTYTWKQCVFLSCALILVCVIVSNQVMGGWF